MHGRATVDLPDLAAKAVFFGLSVTEFYVATWRIALRRFLNNQSAFSSFFASVCKEAIISSAV